MSFCRFKNHVGILNAAGFCRIWTRRSLCRSDDDEESADVQLVRVQLARAAIVSALDRGPSPHRFDMSTSAFLQAVLA